MAYYFFDIIPIPTVFTYVGLGLLCLVLCIFEKYVSNMSGKDVAEIVQTKTHQHSLRYQLGKLLAQQLGYFRNAEGTRIKELVPNSRFLRFSNGHGMSEQGTSLAGDEPYITWNDGKPEVVLSSPQHMKDFYGRNTKGHEKPPNMGFGPYFDRVLGSSVGVLNGQEWKTMRKNFDPHFSHKLAMDFRSPFSREVANWMKHLPATSTESRHDSLTKSFIVDASAACKTLPFKLVASVLYGEALSDSAFEELVDLNTIHEKVMSKAFFGRSERSRILGMLPSGSKSLMDGFEREWRTFNLKMIQVAKDQGLSCPIATVYPSVLNGTIEERDFLHTIDEILFANIDVTSSVLAFLLINLARKVPAQTDLRAEIMDHIADPEAYVQKIDTLLEYTCMESIRLCPAAWFSLPECALSDMAVGGYRIPAGTPCIIDWWRLNTQSPVWNSCGDSGTKFSPRRSQRLGPQDYRWSFLRFGLGSRKCIGKNISSVIMKTFMVAVLKEWELSTVGLAEDEGKEMIDTRKDRFTVTPDHCVQFDRLHGAVA